MTSLADKTQGRTISQVLYIKLEPRDWGGMDIGETDAACEIGKGLVAEAMKVIQMAAEAEGFKVTIETTQIVY